MEMIIGGAYQGKAAYAKAQFPDVDWKSEERSQKRSF